MQKILRKKNTKKLQVTHCTEKLKENYLHNAIITS
jgi:hypothetical protein